MIHTTSKHPFLTVEQGFLPVGQIKLGMHVREGNGQIGLVTGWQVVPGVKVMYNLEVAQDHTFTVGNGLWVVHNCDFPSRNSAFRAAKRDVGIPMGQEPDSVRGVDLTDRNGGKILGADGLPINTRAYVYTRADGSQIVIQEHSAGHQFDEGGVGDQGPHFNVRPIDNTRTGTVPGTLAHYSFSN